MTSSSSSSSSSSSPPKPTTAASRLRQLLAASTSPPTAKAILAPGVYDGITTRLALAQGFECLYMTGAGTSMSRLGMADLGLATFNDMLQNAALVASIDPRVPVVADADTGYGAPINIAHTVRSYARAGIAALHIEDQEQSKRCGHLAGKQLVPRQTYYNRLRAACKARDENPNPADRIVVIARTDARAGRDPQGNGGLAEALERLRAAVEDVGVDAVFLEALQDAGECAEVCARLPPGTPVLLNMVPGGKTPVVSAEEAGRMGFALAIWPTLGLEAVVPALERAYAGLRETGKGEDGLDRGPQKLFEVCGLRELMEFDRSVGGTAYDGA
ncbi:hypothetical protein MBLNU230_g7670t1 [Neophaeotheca triangularis]